MPYMPQDSLPFPKNPVHDCEPSKLSIPVPRGKHIVIQIVPDEPYVLRIDSVLVSTEVLLATLRPDADPRKWFRFERTPSPSHPEEDIITVHTETREAQPERGYYDGQLVTAPDLNGHPYSVVSAELWKGEWLYKLSNCLGRYRESELSLELRSK